jgi:hypothetical protein
LGPKVDIRIPLAFGIRIVGGRLGGLSGFGRPVVEIFSPAAFLKSDTGALGLDLIATVINYERL